ncbi:MAG: PEP-CTERM sorting domain-containing protein [Pirellulales bacterium]|nr:PEP-CTERM sorting domain-containing protein [Pirellulales bacterium]
MLAPLRMSSICHDGFVQCGPALLVLGFLVMVLPAARGAVIFNNGTPQLVPTPAQGALFADANHVSFTEAAENFSLGAGQNVIRDVHWWGIYNTGTVPAADAFTIQVYNNNAAAPGTVNTTLNLLNLTRTATGTTFSGRMLYLYDAVVADVALTASTTYWLGISNNSGGNDWAWAQSANSGGNAHQYSVANGSFFQSNKSLAFNLTNEIVPEPTSLTLLSTGMALLGWASLARRRRRG